MTPVVVQPPAAGRPDWTFDVRAEGQAALERQYATAWYLAYTAYRAEFRVVQALAEQRIDAYCPAATVWRTHARKREPAPVALLPRYVFVQLHVHGPRFDLVKATDGVECLIGDKLRPSRLTAADVAALERIRADEAAGMFDTTSAAIAEAARRAKRRLKSFTELRDELQRGTS
jgi:transcription antitermination factor NusG